MQHDWNILTYLKQEMFLIKEELCSDAVYLERSEEA